MFIIFSTLKNGWFRVFQPNSRMNRGDGELMCDLDATVSNCRQRRRQWPCVCMRLVGFCFGYDCVLPQTKIKSVRGFTVSNNFGQRKSEMVVIAIQLFFAFDIIRIMFVHMQYI